MTQALLKETSVDLGDKRVPVRLYRNTRARRLILRIDSQRDGADGVAVTLPRATSQREGLEMVLDKADWVLANLGGLEPRVPFADGERVPLGGVDHLIRHTPYVAGGVWRENGEIFVTGKPEHLARRLGDWLKAEAKRRIGPLARDKAMILGRPAGRISIRDTKSRWGSCSLEGNLSFCWRLVLAPETVLDYVVAHEVGHLAELNHGPKFWRAVAELTADMNGAKKWLRLNGEKLHRYG
ncbi:MAG: M48 family metallopeptidase [Rhodospirillales bacterium]|nr:M48 family metallopeptidase [Rhodospirillales bacterium]